MGARKAKICEYPVAHELGDETVIARDRARAGVLVGTDDFPRVLGLSRAESAVEPTRSHATCPIGIRLPGMERATAQRLVESAHQVCPYSRATHGNIAV